MSRKFITGVLVVAATITAFAAAPARADNDDLKRFVGAAATLYLLGRAIEHAGDNGYTVRTHGYVHNGHGAHNGHGYVPRPRHNVRPPLPRKCLVRVNKPWTKYALGAGCLKNSYRAFNKLPQRCAMQIQRKKGKAWGYAARCLLRSGYKLARH
ncbi:hypothetical protein [Thalassococcus lentus]|uniref:Uncharacterized protein n=1 Tax=Thalassococcus lentus TaxID=1210524 RepID=A0ABT4XSV8_9RHOB|nr:hypothetical protein [Thalassococcus lentus]MDA7425034.1 hypothetical protein [Thalassococcus lentus]